jgi:hypothetical protein
MMRKFLPIIFFMPLVSFAQDCEDLYRTPDEFHIVATEYEPVCGCDGQTYRNSDAAYWWGAINTWTSNTICGNFDIDLYPTVVTSGSTVPPHLRIYMKYGGTASMAIYDSFGRFMFEKRFDASQTEMVIPEADPYDIVEAQGFPYGIYVLVVSVGGDRLSRKFMVVTDSVD